MGLLQHFFKNVFKDETYTFGCSSFEQVPNEDLEVHLSVARYGNFELTEAIRPSYDLKIVPQNGYRYDYYRDSSSERSIPVLMASISKENLFETFLELLEPLGPVVDVVLESSHETTGRGHDDFYREHIDLPVLKSNLYFYEDLLTNDGCIGIAVLNPKIPVEVQFDEHKLLIVYGENLKPFERIFERQNVKRNEKIRFLTEAEHVHSSRGEYMDQFHTLQNLLGMDSPQLSYI
ncbi:MAG: hypothetical protein FWC43_05055 [Planctomycetaceae bacterium]|nr:hypothetical protein [Planctomycetaceae bacterium]